MVRPDFATNHNLEDTTLSSDKSLRSSLFVQDLRSLSQLTSSTWIRT